MEEIPSKPYLVRALHEWCTDNGYTPYILVEVGNATRVPRAYVHEGHITLNVSALATQHLTMDNETIAFQARFGGVLEHVAVPVSAVQAIYARETGVGMGFQAALIDAAPHDTAKPAAAPEKAAQKPALGSAGSGSTAPTQATLPGISKTPATPPVPSVAPAKHVTLVPVSPAKPGDSKPEGTEPTDPPRRPKLTLVK